MNFVNFDISIESKTSDGYLIIANNTVYGQGRGLCKLDPASADIQKTLETISKEAVDGPGLIAFGKMLGANLFNGTVEEIFSKTLGGVQAQERTGVRIRLRINPAELNVLPWEFVQLATASDPLATSVQTVVSRYIELNETVRKVEAPLPLRMLGIIPQGSGLDTDKEKAALNKAVEELGGSLKLSWLEGKVTRDAIREKLGEADYHVVHFIGHGYMDGTQASLRLTDEYGDDYPVAAETFAGFFRDSSVRLVVLNACRGAARSASDAALGVAPQVVRRGVPAVVAMQWDINDRVAQSFARTFYRSLCMGPEAGEVDTAVTRGRAVLYDDWPGNRAYATPVLFLRSEDGQLWKKGNAGPEARETSITTDRPSAIVQNIGVQVSGGSVAGDVTGGNKIATGDNSDVIIASEGSTVVRTEGAPGGAAVVALLTQAKLWQAAMESMVNNLDLSPDEKKDLKDQVAKLKAELAKNVRLDPIRLAKLANTLGMMGSNDLVEMTVKRLGPPLLVIGFSVTMNTDFKVYIEKQG
jgi:hypothetical protein